MPVKYTFTIINHHPATIQETLSSLERFEDLHCVNTATNKEDGLNAILEHRPHLVFIGLDSKDEKSLLLLGIINELYRYLDIHPYFIVTANTRDYAYDAIKAGVTDYILQPLAYAELLKCFLKIKKNSIAAPVTEEPVKRSNSLMYNDKAATESIDNGQICIKSYGDYQFIALNEIMYLKADNNTTDFHLESGRQLTAYKTLKFYENNLPSHFFRIHNSYIVNSKFVTRINTGKSLCYLNGDTAVAFSKTFKDNIEAIIKGISPEYL